jgi:acyl-CoA synthetase (NDP forming)
LLLTFGSAAQRDVVKEGPVSVLSQSGSIGGGILRNLLERGVGCRYFVSVGNETDLTTIDYLEYLVARGDSTTILMFVEGLRDGERLREVAAAARAQGTRLVALKAGSSEAGRQATASHTGKIASSQKIYSSIFKQCGVLEVAGIGDLVEVAEVLSAALPVPSLPGPAGLAVVGISGGSRALIADACETAGVPLATFAPSTEAALVEVIPAYGQARNPTDVTGQVLSRPEVFEHAVKTIAGDPATGAVLVQYANRGPTQVQENADLLARTTLESRKPVVASFLADDIDASTRRRLADAHIVCASAPDVAVKYVSWLYAARATQEAAVADADARVSVGPASSAPDLGSWRDQTAFLQRCGIAVPRWQVVDRAHPEGGADLDLVPPLVVKALPEDSDHKTEQGLVRLGLADADAARAAMAQMQQRTGCHRFLVQEMVTGGVEALLTVRDDPDFGPVLAIGSGGTLVEWLDDVAYVSVPCTRAEVLSALRRTGLHELLGGFRGAAPKDVDALVDAALALSEAYLRMADRPADLELNPLFVLDRGDGVTAVDVLVARPR